MKLTMLFLFICSSLFLQSQEVKYLKSVKLAQEILESSGLVVASDTSFYTINDGGNASILYEINKKGKII